VSNLLEKALLIGFGIFTLIIFTSIIIPFFNEIINFKSQKEDLEEYTDFINEMDIAVKFIINNPTLNYYGKITYPEKLNITFQNYDIGYYFILGDTLNYKIMTYNEQFYQNLYHNFPSGLYSLNVSIYSTLIKVQFE
jgi:hypothetical protein